MTAHERIEAAIAARDKATPGPWDVDVFEGNEIIVANGTFLAKLWLRKNWDTESNATLIAAAPDLATEVIRLRKWQQEAVRWLEGARATMELVGAPKDMKDTIDRLIAEAQGD